MKYTVNISVTSDPVDVDIITSVVPELGGKLIIAAFSLKRPVQVGDDVREIAELIATAITQYGRPTYNDIVVVSGRGPIYLYALIQHNLHGNVNVLAFYDPKLPGAVIVSSNNPNYREGDVVNIPESIAEKLAQPKTPGSQ